MDDFITQNCIDWNIRQRDWAKGKAVQSPEHSPLRKSFEHDARRHQRNIDALNQVLALNAEAGYFAKNHPAWSTSNA